MDGRRPGFREELWEQNPAYSPTRLPLPAALPWKGPLIWDGGPFRSFGGLPCYAAESPSEVPQTGLKVPEKSLERRGGRSRLARDAREPSEAATSTDSEATYHVDLCPFLLGEMICWYLTDCDWPVLFHRCGFMVQAAD